MQIWPRPLLLLSLIYPNEQNQHVKRQDFYRQRSDVAAAQHEGDAGGIFPPRWDLQPRNLYLYYLERLRVAVHWLTNAEWSSRNA